MGLFSNLNRKANGMLNMIRCDLQDYLVWHWTPANGNEGRSNAVRFGSSLRVRDGEVAVFGGCYPDALRDTVCQHLRPPFPGLRGAGMRRHDVVPHQRCEAVYRQASYDRV